MGPLPGVNRKDAYVGGTPTGAGEASLSREGLGLYRGRAGARCPFPMGNGLSKAARPESGPGTLSQVCRGSRAPNQGCLAQSKRLGVPGYQQPELT